MTKREPTASRKLQIADAALKIIATHGVARFTTAAIAREVGMTEGALFRHFTSKEEIVLAAIGRVEELFELDAPDLEGPPLERLRGFLEHRVRVVHQHGGIPRLVFSDELASVAGGAGSARARAIRERARATIRGCLEEAKRTGHLADGLDVEAASMVVLGTVMGLVFSEPPRAVVVRTLDALERMLRRG